MPLCPARGDGVDVTHGDWATMATGLNQGLSHQWENPCSQLQAA